MVKITTICLIRHGETDWNAIGKLQGKTDIPLNRIGIKQAEECGLFLRGASCDVIVTSPLKRAKETAQIIHEYVQFPLYVEMEDFAERDFGDAEGLLPDERRERYPEKEYPNQEERELFRERVMGGIKQLNILYPNKKLILVAHGAVINVILDSISNGEIGSSKTKLTNACISNVYYAKDTWSVKDFNGVTHLSIGSDVGGRGKYV